MRDAIPTAEKPGAKRRRSGSFLKFSGSSADGEPKPALSMLDAVALIVGIVVGAGIFSFPSLVAGNTASATMFLSVWILGGLVSLVGALCYAELASAFPSAGGDYTFLKRAFGNKLAFLFAWARMSIIQTGSAAILAFIFGDYATQLYSLGEFSPMVYAALIISVADDHQYHGRAVRRGRPKVIDRAAVLRNFNDHRRRIFLCSGAGRRRRGDNRRRRNYQRRVARNGDGLCSFDLRRLERSRLYFFGNEARQQTDRPRFDRRSFYHYRALRAHQSGLS
jgi:hypothetical protein